MADAHSTSADPAADADLENIGACLNAIRALSRDNGDIDDEDLRAIYSLSCIALIEWRKLDAADRSKVEP